MMKNKPRSIVVVCSMLLFMSQLHAQEIIEERPEYLKLPIDAEARQQRQKEESVRDAATVFGLGMLRYRGDRWLEAVQLLEESARIDPRSPSPWKALVPIYLALAREDDAREACQKVLERDPNDGAIAYQLARFLKADGANLEAIKVLSRGLESTRLATHPELHYQLLVELSELQFKAGDYPGAINAYQNLCQHLLEERAALVGGETLTSEKHALAVSHAYEQQGQCYLLLKKHAEAIKVFLSARDYLAGHKDSAIRVQGNRLSLNLAETRIAQGRWSDALMFLDDYLQFHPVEVEPYAKKVEMLHKLHRDDEVIPVLLRHAAKVPDALNVQLLLAEHLSRSPDHEEKAVQLYRQLADRFQEPEVFKGLFKLLRKQNRPGEILQLVDETLIVVQNKESTEFNERENARERGLAMLTVLKSEKAVVESLVNYVLTTGFENKIYRLATWQLLAGLAARARMLPKAESVFRICLKLADPKQEASIYISLLEVLRYQRKYEEIIKVCQDALHGRSKPEVAHQIVLHNQLAVAYGQNGKFEEAIQECDLALALATQAQKINLQCHKAQIYALAGRWDQAIATCDKMLKELNRAAEIKRVRNTLSIIYHEKGDHAKSEEQSRLILEKDPIDAEANNNLGYHLAEQNRNLDEAEKRIRKAIEVDQLLRRDETDSDPENAAYLDSLGWVLFRKGKLTEARDWLLKASSYPAGAEDPTVWDHLGDVYFKLGEMDRARTCYESAIQMYQFDRQARKEGRLDEARRKLKLTNH